jgi:hypothetical protein
MLDPIIELSNVQMCHAKAQEIHLKAEHVHRRTAWLCAAWLMPPVLSQHVQYIVSSESYSRIQA